jgi:predicted membrane channel-forming protein YqfA (hemolysin III family)
VNEPSWRKPTGIFLILLLILVWAVIVATASSWIGNQHMLVQLLIYVVAGIVWIAPLKPLLAWMETGHWRR